ncbi:carbonic anhydrase [Gracilinema caldarium]|uniref:Carbonic anhydrase n=1 Tax=Gracilinema caldarium (strain ATCC 51460 / DSM 7334 / H1) TaxID=744872 RepID=F8F346_GRAC1|nr:carbonic anhydrase [Gracilinema caldarium]AEJ20372.1 Carbonate dehydratase [Gracilinema caldarium DSM 7334]
MEYLFDGVREFNQKDYREYKNLFQGLSRRQQPHTLFIGCSDSRVVPNLITKTLPGELFVIRNIANIVPFYRESEEFLATTAAIEYAVQVLKVDNILICGHSNCGGCKALYMDEHQTQEIPHTKKWLELAGRVKQKILSEPVLDELEREWKTEQLNVVEQMNHLITYPYIKEKYRNKEINILGWYYHIETGDVFNYNPEEKRFVKIT